MSTFSCSNLLNHSHCFSSKFSVRGCCLISDHQQDRGTDRTKQFRKTLKFLKNVTKLSLYSVDVSRSHAAECNQPDEQFKSLWSYLTMFRLVYSAADSFRELSGYFLLRWKGTLDLCISFICSDQASDVRLKLYLFTIKRCLSQQIK